MIGRPPPIPPKAGLLRNPFNCLRKNCGARSSRRAVEKPIVGRVIKKTVVKGNRNCDANVMESYL